MTKEELKRARNALKLSQHAFGAAIGVSASMVHSMESGRREIGLTVDLAVRYCLLRPSSSTNFRYAAESRH